MLSYEGRGHFRIVPRYPRAFFRRPGDGVVVTFFLRGTGVALLSRGPGMQDFLSRLGLAVSLLQGLVIAPSS